jgi:hypothetical protein
MYYSTFEILSRSQSGKGPGMLQVAIIKDGKSQTHFIPDKPRRVEKDRFRYWGRKGLIVIVESPAPPEKGTIYPCEYHIVKPKQRKKKRPSI